MKLLLIEDSQRLQRSLGLGLRRAGYALDIAGDGQTGLQLAETHHYDVIILDLMLPEMDGITLLRRLRAGGGDAHVIILTAKDSTEDRVQGLRAGADDFMAKPFAFDELEARIQALIRRRHGHKNPNIVVGPLNIDTAARRVMRAGKPVTLAPREYALLEYLIMRRGEVISRREIEERLYAGQTEIASNAVDSAICSLRRRIDGDDETSLIETRRGFGYILREES